MPKLPMTFAVLFLPFLLTGCAINSVATDGSCQVFRPISNSQKDTEQTRREVIAHNKVYGAICKG